MATYLSPNLGLDPGQVAIARVQVASLNPSGSVKALVGLVDVTLVGETSAPAIEDFSDDSNPAMPGLDSSGVFEHSFSNVDGWMIVDQDSWQTFLAYPSSPHALALFGTDTVRFPGSVVDTVRVSASAEFGFGQVEVLGTGDTLTIVLPLGSWRQFEISSTDLGDEGNPMDQIIEIRLSGGEVLFDNIEIVGR